MTTFANVSEIRTQINPFIKKAQQGDQVILMRYGKPTAALLDYKKLDYLTALEKRWKKRTKARKSLEKINAYFSENQIDKEWLAKKGLKRKNLTDEEIIDLVANA